MTYSVSCEKCGRSNASLVERTIPTNYHVEKLLLCQKCRSKMGLAPMSKGTKGYYMGPREMHGGY